MLSPMFYTHVKWFVGNKEGHEHPLPYEEIITGPFLFWLGVTLFGLLLSAVFNERLQRISFIAQIHGGLDRAKRYVPIIFRIGLGLGLLLQLVSNSYLAPEMEANALWIKLVMAIAIAGLVIRRTLPVSGLALAVLFVWSIYEHGWFHGLDYVFYLGIIFYLLVIGTRNKELATPVLYLFTGLSLAWVACEKLALPGLSYHIVEEFGIPTFGFSMEHFVLISAFIELGLAWTFIVGILNRFISIIVTLVFITTTTVFGFTEIVGHTIVHMLLVVFLIQGEGTFRTPFQFHRSPLLRYLFVLVNFCVLLFGMLWVYVRMGSLA